MKVFPQGFFGWKQKVFSWLAHTVSCEKSQLSKVERASYSGRFRRLRKTPLGPPISIPFFPKTTERASFKHLTRPYARTLAPRTTLLSMDVGDVLICNGTPGYW